ncbi:hypothetical protein AAC387_Pa06g1760 [Persea americana]
MILESTPANLLQDSNMFKPSMVGEDALKEDMEESVLPLTEEGAVDVAFEEERPEEAVEPPPAREWQSDDII